MGPSGVLPLSGGTAGGPTDDGNEDDDEDGPPPPAPGAGGVVSDTVTLREAVETARRQQEDEHYQESLRKIGQVLQDHSRATVPDAVQPMDVPSAGVEDAERGAINLYPELEDPPEESGPTEPAVVPKPIVEALGDPGNERPMSTESGAGSVQSAGDIAERARSPVIGVVVPRTKGCDKPSRSQSGPAARPPSAASDEVTVVATRRDLTGLGDQRQARWRRQLAAQFQEAQPTPVVDLEPAASDAQRYLSARADEAGFMDRPSAHTRLDLGLHFPPLPTSHIPQGASATVPPSAQEVADRHMAEDLQWRLDAEEAASVSRPTPQGPTTTSQKEATRRARLNAAQRKREVAAPTSGGASFAAAGDLIRSSAAQSRSSSADSTSETLTGSPPASSAQGVGAHASGSTDSGALGAALRHAEDVLNSIQQGLDDGALAQDASRQGAARGASPRGTSRPPSREPAPVLAVSQASPGTTGIISNISTLSLFGGPAQPIVRSMLTQVYPATTSSSFTGLSSATQPSITVTAATTSVSQATTGQGAPAGVASQSPGSTTTVSAHTASVCSTSATTAQVRTAEDDADKRWPTATTEGGTHHSTAGSKFWGASDGASSAPSTTSQQSSTTSLNSVTSASGHESTSSAYVPTDRDKQSGAHRRRTRRQQNSVTSASSGQDAPPRSPEGSPGATKRKLGETLADSTPTTSGSAAKMTKQQKGEARLDERAAKKQTFEDKFKSREYQELKEESIFPYLMGVAPVVTTDAEVQCYEDDYSAATIDAWDRLMTSINYTDKGCVLRRIESDDSRITMQIYLRVMAEVSHEWFLRWSHRLCVVGGQQIYNHMLRSLSNRWRQYFAIQICQPKPGAEECTQDLMYLMGMDYMRERHYTQLKHPNARGLTRRMIEDRTTSWDNVQYKIRRMPIEERRLSYSECWQRAMMAKYHWDVLHPYAEPVNDMHRVRYDEALVLHTARAGPLRDLQTEFVKWYLDHCVRADDRIRADQLPYALYTHPQLTCLPLSPMAVDVAFFTKDKLKTMYATEAKRRYMGEYAEYVTTVPATYNPTALPANVSENPGYNEYTALDGLPATRRPTDEWIAAQHMM